MWLLLIAAILQVTLILERILYRIILLFVVNKRSGVKKLADNTVLGSCVGALTYYTSLPVQLGLAFGDVILRNVFLYVSVVTICGILFLICSNVSSFLVTSVTAYNCGIGQSLDLILQALQLPNLIASGLVPIYNGWLYLWGQLVYWVIIPLTRVNVDAIPTLIENLTLTATSLVLSASTFLQNVLYCSDLGATSSQPGTSLLFVPGDKQCIGNVNYYTMDIMTPGIYMRKTATSFKDIFTTSCGPAGLLVELIMFPLLDLSLIHI